MSKFKIGDMVKVIRWNKENNLKKYNIGEVFTISKVEESCFNTIKYWYSPEDNSYNHAEDELELVRENKLTNNNIIMSLVSKFKSIVRTEPEKTLVKVGVLDEELSLTTEGSDLFLQFLFEKNKAEFKTEVADKLVEVEK